MKKNHALILLGIAAVLLFAAAQPALALETSYPDLTALGAPNINTSPTLLNVIQYFFILAIGIAGAVALISITISGMKILLAAGNPTAISDARENLIQTALGIALLLGAFILIKTINPQLANPALYNLPQQTLSGVILETVYTTGTGQNSVLGVTVPFTDQLLSTPYIVSTQAPQSAYEMTPIVDLTLGTAITQGTETITSVKSTGATQRIRYICTPPSATIPGRRLMIWKYSSPGFLVDRAANGSGLANSHMGTYYLPCNSDPNNFISLSNANSAAGSYKWAYEEPGVYFFLKAGCDTGTASSGGVGGVSTEVQTTPGVIQSFDSQLNEDQTPTYMRIVNSQEKQFGVIVNESEDAQGACSYPKLNIEAPTANQLVTSSCIPVPPTLYNGESSPKYAYVFQQVPSTTYPNSTISFQSEHLYTNVTNGNFDSAFNNRLYQTPNIYQNFNDFLKQPHPGDNPQGLGQNLYLDYGFVPPEDECTYPNEQCLSFIRRNAGKYRVVLYSANNADENSLPESDVCQIYTCQEDNFNAGNTNRWIFNSQRTIYKMFIIPMPNNVETCSRS